MAAQYVVVVLLLSGVLANASFGGALVEEPGLEVNADVSDKRGNKVEADSAVVDSDVEMTGVAVVNGAVWIDGVRIHKPQFVYTSKKSGKNYRIQWGHNGNVSVAED